MALSPRTSVTMATDQHMKENDLVNTILATLFVQTIFNYLLSQRAKVSPPCFTRLNIYSPVYSQTLYSRYNQLLWV